MIITLIGSEVVNFRRNDYIKQFGIRIKDRTYMWSGWLIKLITRPGDTVHSTLILSIHYFKYSIIFRNL